MTLEDKHLRLRNSSRQKPRGPAAEAARVVGRQPDGQRWGRENISDVPLARTQRRVAGVGTGVRAQGTGLGRPDPPQGRGRVTQRRFGSKGVTG